MTEDNWLNETTVSEQTTRWVPTPSSYRKMNYKDPWIKLFCFSCKSVLKTQEIDHSQNSESQDLKTSCRYCLFFSYRCWYQSSICDVWHQNVTSPILQCSKLHILVMWATVIESGLLTHPNCKKIYQHYENNLSINKCECSENKTAFFWPLLSKLTSFCAFVQIMYIDIIMWPFTRKRTLTVLCLTGKNQRLING